MKRWISLLIFLLAFPIASHVSASNHHVDEQKLGPFYYTVYNDTSSQKWDIGVLNHEEKTNISETKLNNEGLLLFKETIDELAKLSIQLGIACIVLIGIMLFFIYRLLKRKRLFLRISLLASSVAFTFLLVTTIEIFKKTEQAKTLFYLV
ncbi:hypothetical protein LZP85_11345 [Priestia flexa]|jgi:hypothetical protein|uniref:Uncharacterized protein n=1 Tax=Priestia flexa TaxID=86664 RepID=A0A8I1MFS9_9BACI|nr:hypothetical protein [Priestia flexa]MBN8251949.1 hypothetical protein [Priestia flexa]MBN8435451.1 hypothetical protein [Priestia flexa]MCA0967973.1 hypothetical protein [Priestia flexa]RIV12371.1 hypothetical protein D1859_05360 [Priestia flexa]UIR28590.1 hypothetical protein LZP85_11345 [Priestia flexa]